MRRATCILGVAFILACGAQFEAAPAGAGGALAAGGSGGAAAGGAAAGGSGGTEPIRCRALRFDGSDDRVQVADDGALDLLGTMTLDAWVNIEANENEMHILSHHHHEQQTGYVLLIYGGDAEGRHHMSFRYQVGSTRHQVGYEEVTVGEWHHVAGSYDGGTLRLFLDGRGAEGSDIDDGLQTADYDGPLNIGYAAYTNGFAFRGLIDEVRLSDVARDFAAEPAPRALELDANTLALWRFDEPDGKQDALDETGNHSGSLGASAALEAEDPVREDIDCP